MGLSKSQPVTFPSCSSTTVSVWGLRDAFWPSCISHWTLSHGIPVGIKRAGVPRNPICETWSRHFQNYKSQPSWRAFQKVLFHDDWLNASKWAGKERWKWRSWRIFNGNYNWASWEWKPISFLFLYLENQCNMIIKDLVASARLNTTLLLRRVCNNKNSLPLPW